MRIIKINNGVDSNYTCYMSEMDANYSDLVRLFGDPLPSRDGYKIDVEWLLEFDDGQVLTIYNWKDGVNYCGKIKGKNPEQITNWHIGGRDSEIAHIEFLKQMVNSKWPIFDNIRRDIFISKEVRDAKSC